MVAVRAKKQAAPGKKTPRHFYVPMDDSEVRQLRDVKKQTGLGIAFFVREAILEKLARERGKLRQFPGAGGEE